MSASFMKTVVGTLFSLSIFTWVAAAPVPMDGGGDWHTPSLHIGRVRTKSKSGRSNTDAQTSRLDHSFNPGAYNESQTSRAHFSQDIQSQQYTSRARPRSPSRTSWSFPQVPEDEHMPHCNPVQHEYGSSFTPNTDTDFNAQQPWSDYEAYSTFNPSLYDGGADFSSMSVSDTLPYAQYQGQHFLNTFPPVDENSDLLPPPQWHYDPSAGYSLPLQSQHTGGSSSSASFGEPNNFVFTDTPQDERDPFLPSYQIPLQHLYAPDVPELPPGPVPSSPDPPAPPQAKTGQGKGHRQVLAANMSDLKEKLRRQVYVHLHSLDVDLGYDWRQDDEELCWRKMSSTAREKVVAVINLALNYQAQGVKEKMARILTPILAVALLSGRKEMVEDALYVLYEPGQRRSCLRWKERLVVNETVDEPEELVRRLSALSGQKPEKIRVFLSSKRISADQAYQLFHNYSSDDLRQYIIDENLVWVPRSQRGQVPRDNVSLMKQGDQHYRPWKEKTNAKQRAAIIKIVMRVLECTKTGAAWFLEKDTVAIEDKIGLQILSAEEEGMSDREMHALIEVLTKSKIIKSKDRKHHTVDRG
ncbi:hypothetical protein CBS101457_003016 [Exobasidium rhododendri]|nr:hypothetical protein CBS101457_003016 [Exobasidium rhododendri]